jgi:hypothetical protein
MHLTPPGFTLRAMANMLFGNEQLLGCERLSIVHSLPRL